MEQWKHFIVRHWVSYWNGMVLEYPDWSSLAASFILLNAFWDSANHSHAFLGLSSSWMKEVVTAPSTQCSTMEMVSCSKRTGRYSCFISADCVAVASKLQILLKCFLKGTFWLKEWISHPDLLAGLHTKIYIFFALYIQLCKYSVFCGSGFTEFNVI